MSICFETQYVYKQMTKIEKKKRFYWATVPERKEYEKKHN